ncbi:protein of unknown function [Azospirillum baldaniorum]|uniref:Uncharacterized protein n=1 Tax=Azospirillum baldaniorum TaxID=1064539 RepID=A0A9P1JNK1_9PROT|nr:protein of unknown function [Azospirillum baldaniorum]
MLWLFGYHKTVLQNRQPYSPAGGAKR